MPYIHKVCSACNHDAGEKYHSARKCPKCGELALQPLGVAVTTVAAEHLQQVYAWVLDGHDEHHIREAIQQQWPNANPPALLAAAVDQLAKSADFDEALVLGFCLEATRHLYQRMLAIGDFSGALKAIQQLHKLAASTPPIPAESAQSS